MTYKSKYTGQQLEALLDKVAEGSENTSDVTRHEFDLVKQLCDGNSTDIVDLNNEIDAVSNTVDDMTGTVANIKSTLSELELGIVDETTRATNVEEQLLQSVSNNTKTIAATTLSLQQETQRAKAAETALSSRIDNLVIEGGGTGSVEVLDTLDSTSTIAALSANKGRELKETIDGFGEASTKDVTNVISENSQELITSGAVYTAVSNLENINSNAVDAFSMLGMSEESKTDGYEIALSKATNTAEKIKVKVPVFDTQNMTKNPVGLVDEIFVEDMAMMMDNKINDALEDFTPPEGGSNVTIVQETGASTTDVMSQKAVTDAIAAEKKRAETIEGNLSGSIGSLGTTISNIGNELIEEKARAEEAEKGLSDRIDNLENNGEDGSTEVVDNLTSTSKTAALSANQGKVLNEKIEDLQGQLETDATNLFNESQARITDVAALQERANSTESQVAQLNSRAQSLSAEIDRVELYTGVEEYSLFDDTQSYSVGDIVRLSTNELRRFTADYNGSGTPQYEPWNLVLDTERAKTPDNMGYVILRKGVSFTEQMTKENTIYEIRYDFDLGGETVTIPSGCVLKFEGGKIENGTITGKHTQIVSDSINIIDESCILDGKWCVNNINALWFGVEGLESTNIDITKGLQRAILLAETFASAGVHINNRQIKIYIPFGEYKITDTIRGVESTSYRHDAGITLDFCGSYIYTYDNENHVIFDMIMNSRVEIKNVLFYNPQGIKANQDIVCFNIKTGNGSYCYITYTDCVFDGYKIAVDTVSFAESRSTTLTFNRCVFRETIKSIKSYCDLLGVYDCNFHDTEYNTNESYIECRGLSNIQSTVFNPRGIEGTDEGKRWIDFGRGDGSITEDSFLNVIGCRFGNEKGAITPVYNWSKYEQDIARAIITLKGCTLGLVSAYKKAAVVLKEMPMLVVIDACDLPYNWVNTSLTNKYVVLDGEITDMGIDGVQRIIIRDVPDSYVANKSIHSLIDDNLHKYLIVESVAAKSLHEQYVRDRVFRLTVKGVIQLCRTQGDSSFARMKVQFIINNEIVDALVTLTHTSCDCEILSCHQTRIDIGAYIRQMPVGTEDVDYNSLMVVRGSDTAQSVYSVKVLESNDIIWLDEVGVSYTKTDHISATVVGKNSYVYSFADNNTDTIAEKMKVGQSMYDVLNNKPMWKSTTNFGLVDGVGNPVGALREGTFANRPKCLAATPYIDQTHNGRPIFFSSKGWVRSDGYPVFTAEVGASTSRPELTSTDSGYIYFDTTLGKPIWWNGSAWVDSSGATV